MGSFPVDNRALCDQSSFLVLCFRFFNFFCPLTNVIAECKSDGMPWLIQHLSHPLRSFAVLLPEKIVELVAGDFLSAVRTATGKVFWW